tara:strand:- start:436 stop:588 length:153 start_codon:yes stop_codon:yes gene_type:complete
MIILKLVGFSDFYAESETIEIAKGKYKLPETLKEGYKQVIRQYKWIRKAT